MDVEITEKRSSAVYSDTEYDLKLDEYDMRALLRILLKVKPSYSDYAEKWSDRWREQQTLDNILDNARVLDILPNL